MTFNSALETLLQEFGGTAYKTIPIENMKLKVSETLKEVVCNSSPEKAVVSKFRTKIANSKSKEMLLTAISEQMFTLSGESV